MTLRALLVDDEAAARRNLRALLRAHPEITIAGEAADAAEARRRIAEDRPDVVFLDIQMPGESGFDLLASLDDPPAIIFVTAYDRYAIRAFEVNALDYLLKPVDPRRLASALARLPKPDVVESELSADFEPVRLTVDDRILLDSGCRRHLVAVRGIERIEADGEYSQACLASTGETFMVRRSLKTWMRMLPDALFFRIHRATIINLAFVESIERNAGTAGVVVLGVRGGKPLPVSRRFAPALLRRLKDVPTPGVRDVPSGCSVTEVPTRAP